ncbi:MAG: FAD-dependent oxidoreductase [Candidatus Pacearchaeota archaeon]|jgi:thioredoxin reductase (NADPH)
MTKKYDVIIVGAGPGGITAAVYCFRYNLKTLVIGELPGGYVGLTHKICNVPGDQGVSGPELAKKMINHLQNIDVDFKQETVQSISGKNGNFKVKTNKTEYLGKKIIIATGTEHRKLGLKEEEKFFGKGISYCATCDAGFYKDKIAGVVGGGNSALTAAILLSKYAKEIFLIYRGNSFSKGEPRWVKEVEENPKIKILFNSEVKEIKGKEKFEGVEIITKGKKKELKLDGVFIEIGSVPNIKLAEELNLKLENLSIKVDKEKRTNVKGVYAIGDVTDTPFKQILTAQADGAIAANSAYIDLGMEK